jgi:FtsH-binding integral membrane protein
MEGLTNLNDPYNGLASGSIVFLIILIIAVTVVAVVFRNKQTCYAINFTAILIVMAFIMWDCTYMCHMFPLVHPKYTWTE